MTNDTDKIIVNIEDAEIKTTEQINILVEEGKLFGGEYTQLAMTMSHLLRAKNAINRYAEIRQNGKLKTAYKKDVEYELKQIKDYYNALIADCVEECESEIYRGLTRDKNAALSEKWYELSDKLTDDVAKLLIRK